MRRNDLNKRIEIYEMTKISDGYGGYLTSTSKVTSTWAKIEPVEPGQYTSDSGSIEAFKSVKFTIRKRNDLTLKVGKHFILYRGLAYSITNPPYELGFKNKFIVLFGAETEAELTSSSIFFDSGFYDTGFYVGAE